LTKKGKIVTFLCSEGWVEVRRKQKKEVLLVDYEKIDYYFLDVSPFAQTSI